MKSGRTLHPMVFVILATLMLSACGAPEHPPAAAPLAGVSIEMTNPQHSMAIGTGQWLDIHASVHSTIGSPTQITFFANGTSVGGGSLRPGDSFDATSDSVWTPRAAGEYWLQAQASFPNGSTALSDPVRVCVFDGFNTTFYSYDGSCQIPAHSSSPSSTTVTMQSIVSPQQLIVFPVQSSCSGSAAITAIAEVSGDSNQIEFVTINLSFNGMSIGNQALTWITNHSDGQKEYRRTIDLLPYISGALPASTTIAWEMKARNEHGTAIQIQHGNVLLLAGQCDLQHLQNSTITPTATSAGCPAGTYLAPSSQQCVQIQIVTPRPDSGNGNQCPAGQTWTCSGITHQTCSCK